MNSSENFHSYLRLSLPLMSKHNIPVTPQNYAVWYAYVSGTNETLNQTIDSMLANGKNFDDETNQSLYRRFGLGIDNSEIMKLRDDLKQLLITLLEQVMMFCGQTGNLESTLQLSVEKLSSEISIQEIKTIVDQIKNETHAIGGLGKILHRDLEQKSKELDELKKAFDNACKEALKDFLTGVANRKGFDKELVGATYCMLHRATSLCVCCWSI